MYGKNQSGETESQRLELLKVKGGVSLLYSVLLPLFSISSVGSDKQHIYNPENINTIPKAFFIFADFNHLSTEKLLKV